MEQGGGKKGIADKEESTKEYSEGRKIPSHALH